MTSLLRHDPLAHLKADKDEIDVARLKAEGWVPVDGKIVQFDALSRQRMLDTIAGMTDEETVEWRMGCNASVELNKQGMQDLYDQTLQNAAQRVRECFQYASELKAKLAAGEAVTQRDIELKSWSCK